MSYIDAFVLPVPKKNLAAYRRLAQKAGKIWRTYGALQYVETIGDDLAIKMGITFPRLVKPKRGEVIVFSWILYKSRADRDRVNKKVMKDPFMLAMCGKPMPFDMKRMTMGGFKAIVEM